MARRRRQWPQAAVALVLAAVIVGCLVAAASLAGGRPECAAGIGGDACRALVEKLSSRAGILAGASTILMVLLVAGLRTMILPEDRNRAERAREAVEVLDGR